jgi:hypothetical protein
MDAQGKIAVATHGRTSTATGRQRQVARPKSLNGTDDHRHAGYDFALASDVGRSKTGSHRS